MFSHANITRLFKICKLYAKNILRINEKKSFPQGKTFEVPSGLEPL